MLLPRHLAFAAACIGVGALAGCLEAKTYILSGDADGVQISYAGDPNTTLPQARQHCAQFEKVPRFNDADDGIAVYECVAR